MKNITVAILIATLGSACTYAVKPTSAPAVNVYTSYDDKIPGNWSVIIDDSVNVKRDIKPSSHVCSAHTYPFEAGESLRTSITRTLEQVFETTNIRTSPPNSQEMKSGDVSGYAIIRLLDLIPRITCQMGFWSGTCSGTADINIGIDVSGPTGKLLGTTVGASRSFDNDAGGACGGAGEAFAEAYRLALKDTLEKLAERVGNAPKLRAAVE